VLSSQYSKYGIPESKVDRELQLHTSEGRRKAAESMSHYYFNFQQPKPFTLPLSQQTKPLYTRWELERIFHDALQEEADGIPHVGNNTAQHKHDQCMMHVLGLDKYDSRARYRARAAMRTKGTKRNMNVLKSDLVEMAQLSGPFDRAAGWDCG